MPELARFYGIVIRMYHSDHPPPHFHAEYGSHEGVFDIATLSVIAGDLPPRALGLVVEWAASHVDELAANWQLARQHQPLRRIAPLR